MHCSVTEDNNEVLLYLTVKGHTMLVKGHKMFGFPVQAHTVLLKHSRGLEL